jgi:hypothetical protein
MVESLLGSSLPAFIFVTVLLLGFGALMTGRACANTWKPYWQVLAYSVPLAAFGRFLKWSLLSADGLSVSGFLIDLFVTALIGIVSYRIFLARNMVRQYPWLYQRDGVFSWRDRA